MALSEDELGNDPVGALNAWLEDARAAGLGDEPAFTLATVDEDNAPDARVVIIRRSDERGLTFFSDTRSRKGRGLAVQARAALVAYWPSQSRQIRVRGSVEVLPPSESDLAFSARERRSQIGYWSNAQSASVADRGTLKRRFDELQGRFDGKNIPRPDHWVVYMLRPEYIEFWQRGEENLHDRIAYTLLGGSWHAERLYP